MKKMTQMTFVVKETHLDTFGHMNNATYLTLFEEARWDLLNDNGFGIEHIKLSGLGPVILEINIKYLQELRLRKSVTIETQCTSYEGKIGRIQQTMNADGKICCEAQIVFALFSLAERKIVLPTTEWLNAIGA